MKELFKSSPLLRSMYRFTKRMYRTVVFFFEYFQFKRLITTGENRFQLKWKERYPCLDDNTSTSGFDRHYIYHPAWAARVLADTKPEHHVDISSSLHFCSIISAFIPVRFYDYRPVELGLENLRSDSADLLSLPFPDRSITSISCMHVVEHVGLGRYGDPLDPDGDLKGIEELKRVLADNGDLLFVVPMGSPPRIMFNAHRIYEYGQVLEYFHGLELKEFALIPDTAGQGGLVRNADKLMADKQAYGCGCFWFRRTPC